jgi:hypothetical protein
MDPKEIVFKNGKYLIYINNQQIYSFVFTQLHHTETSKTPTCFDVCGIMIREYKYQTTL